MNSPYNEALGATLIERSKRERIVLVGVTLPGHDDADTEAGLDELALLIDTAGADEAARVVQWAYVNPRPAVWPAADFIVGNPPFIGAGAMRGALGDGYAQTLRATWPDVPESADFVMYWWHHAACLVRAAVRRLPDGARAARRPGLDLLRLGRGHGVVVPGPVVLRCWVVACERGPDDGP